MNCIVCDAAGPFPRLYARDQWTLVRCPGCGLVFQDPPPGPELFERAYYDDAGFAEALMAELRATTLRNAREKLTLLGDALPGPGARILDVGASSGAWLEVAAERGLTGTGIELGATTAERARERGLDIRTGRLGDVVLKPGFDLITFWDVLEHLPDPRVELARARELLAPGGMIAATFPNVAGLYPQLTLRLFARRTGVWEHPELPVHLYDFAPDTARRLLRRAGLQPHTAQTYATPYEHFASTVLRPDRVSRNVRLAFDALHRVAYPLARLTDRGNALFVTATR